MKGWGRVGIIARLKLKLQLYCGDQIAIGPGKADLLEAIAREGSISAATRALGMSYRRGWLLVDTMNRCFMQPVVVAQAGGGGKAGARLTPFGETALAAYHALSTQIEGRIASEALTTLDAAIRDAPTKG